MFCDCVPLPWWTLDYIGLPLPKQNCRFFECMLLAVTQPEISNLEGRQERENKNLAFEFGHFVSFCYM